MTRSALDRLRDKYIQSESCWLWTGAKNNDGYGNFRMESRSWLAHRAAYVLLVGPIPDGLTLDHLCRNRACVNPEHLEPVTLRVNVLRSPIAPSAINATKTHCPKGHPYNADNTYISNETGRGCKTCRRDLDASEQRRAFHQSEAQREYRRKYAQEHRDRIRAYNTAWARARRAAKRAEAER